MILFTMQDCFSTCFRWLLLVTLLVHPYYLFGESKTFSPLAYGLHDCISDIQRYYVLQEMHNDAVKWGYGIDYTGIDTICLEIPSDAKPLLLTHYTNFGGVVLNVKNMQKNMALFQMKQPMVQMEITWNQIDKGDIPNNHRDYLIIIEDQEPWTHRIGYNYDHIRKDILLVKNGQLMNNVVASYGTASSKPKISCCDVDNGMKIIKNLTVNRDTTSTYKTKVLSIENQNNVEVQNVVINTPSAGNLYGDAAIIIMNCTNVRVKNVTINGTYSQKNKYGYGISMNNVWNVSFDYLIGKGNWGLFGNNNVNKATLVNCDINRFDVHCYGRDITFKNCTFRNLYNQFSSIYGKVSFDHCQFLDFLPVLFESSYNAYTGFDLFFRDCTWQLKQGQNYLIQAGNPFREENDREELKEKCWPNLFVNNMKVVVPEDNEELYLYGGRTKPRTDVKIGYINNVKVNNMRIVNKEGMQMDTKIFLSNKKITFMHQLETNILSKYVP